MQAFSERLSIWHCSNSYGYEKNGKERNGKRNLNPGGYAGHRLLGICCSKGRSEEKKKKEKEKKTQKTESQLLQSSTTLLRPLGSIGGHYKIALRMGKNTNGLYLSEKKWLRDGYMKYILSGIPGLHSRVIPPELCLDLLGVKKDIFISFSKIQYSF